MMIQANLRAVSWLAVLLGAVVPAVAGQTPEKRTAISTQRVAGAMADAGWKVSAEQVRFLSQVTSRVRDPQLQMVRATHWLEDTLNVELRCRDRRACLPFYVLISGVGTTGKSGLTLNADADDRQAESATIAAKPLMKSGDSATLILADRSLRITMPVICLQNGQRGEKIRVTSTDHKRFYKAEIVGPGLLKAITL